jgi:hypothetical protein
MHDVCEMRVGKKQFAVSGADTTTENSDKGYKHIEEPGHEPREGLDIKTDRLTVSCILNFIVTTLRFSEDTSYATVARFVPSALQPVLILARTYSGMCDKDGDVRE